MTEETERPEEESGENEEKITLPSSGLAEDILGELSDKVGQVPEQDEAESEPALEESDYALESEEEEEEEKLHLVGFMLSGEEYAFEIGQVQEIIRITGWTRVPNAPGHIMGVINLRGRIIPVVDPKVRMGMTATEQTRDSRIMIVEAGKKVLGLLVDSVSQVLRLPTRVIEEAPEEVSEADRDFIKGVGKLEGRLIILLELDKLAGLKAKAA